MTHTILIRTETSTTTTNIQLPKGVTLEEFQEQLRDHLEYWAESSFPKELHIPIAERFSGILFNHHDLSCHRHGKDTCLSDIIDSLITAVRQEKMAYIDSLNANASDQTGLDDVSYDGVGVEFI